MARARARYLNAAAGRAVVNSTIPGDTHGAPGATTMGSRLRAICIRSPDRHAGFWPFLPAAVFDTLRCNTSARASPMRQSPL